VLLLVQGGHGVRCRLLQTCAGWRRGYRAKNIKPKNISVSQFQFPTTTTQVWPNKWKK
jgi:hypothetical protein